MSSDKVDEQAEPDMAKAEPGAVEPAAETTERTDDIDTALGDMPEAQDSDPADTEWEDMTSASPMPDDEPEPEKRQAPMVLVVGLIIAVGVAAFFAGAYVTGMSDDTASEAYIDNAIAKLELKILQNRLPTEQPQAAPPAPRPSVDDDPIIGDPAAPIEIIEFSDFECPFCARFYAQTLPQLITEYIEPGKAKLVFRDFPLQSIHPNAAAAALAGECADDQGKFKGMHDILFERQREWAPLPTVEALQVFGQYATEIEAEPEAFGACIDGQTHLQEIGNDLRDGQNYGITGTPGFFIGNEQLGYVEVKGAQPYEVFKQIIDTQLG